MNGQIDLKTQGAIRLGVEIVSGRRSAKEAEERLTRLYGHVEGLVVTTTPLSDSAYGYRGEAFRAVPAQQEMTT